MMPEVTAKEQLTTLLDGELEKTTLELKAITTRILELQQQAQQVQAQIQALNQRGQFLMGQEEAYKLACSHVKGPEASNGQEPDN